MSLGKQYCPTVFALIHLSEARHK